MRPRERLIYRNALSLLTPQKTKLPMLVGAHRCSVRFQYVPGAVKRGPGEMHGVMMSNDNGAPLTCPECGLQATRRGYEVRINDAESQSKCKQRNRKECPVLKEAASIARQFAAIQGRY